MLSMRPRLAYSPANYFCRVWIALSSSVILFNKWILDTADFREYLKQELFCMTNTDRTRRFSYVPRPETASIPYSFFAAVTLTTWHLAFATLMTQLMARFTTMLDSRHSVPMTGRVYLRAIVPIGAFFSLSLICGNLTYLYLSVSFIQMLKVRSLLHRNMNNFF